MNKIAQTLGIIGIVLIGFSMIIGYIIKNRRLCLLTFLGSMIGGCTCLCFTGIVLNSYKIVVPTIAYGLVMIIYYFTPEHKVRYFLVFVPIIVIVLIVGSKINNWFLNMYNTETRDLYGCEFFTIASSIILIIAKAYICIDKDEAKESVFIALAVIAKFLSLVIYSAEFSLWVLFTIGCLGCMYSIIIVPIISLSLPSGSKDEDEPIVLNKKMLHDLYDNDDED